MDISKDAIESWLQNHPDVPRSEWTLHGRDDATNDRYICWYFNIPDISEQTDQYLDIRISLNLSDIHCFLSGISLNIFYDNSQKSSSAKNILEILDDLYNENMFVEITYAGKKPIIWKIFRKTNNGLEETKRKKAWSYDPFNFFLFSFLVEKTQKRLVLAKKT